MDREYFAYILTNEWNKVLYTGMTNNLSRRIFEHKSGLVEGFSKKYNCSKLIYAESAPTAILAIEREKEIKGWKREKKIKLIETENPDWKDLSVDL